MTTIARSLHGSYRPEHLFSLRQAVELYDFHQEKITDCDRQILEQLKSFDAQNAPDDAPPSNVEKALQRMSGVDLTSIDGIDTNTALKILAEIGTDMTRWKTAKHFASWLGLSPGTKVSGGKVLSSATKPVANKAASALRMAAFTLFNSKSALGAYLRRLRARLGAPKAVTATAHKLARPIDIDSKRMTLRISQGKGGKDRYSILSQMTLEHLRQYWKKYRLAEWLFEGQKKDDHISLSTIQSIFQTAKSVPAAQSL